MGLKKAIRDFSKLYARDPRARNTMIKNITTQFRLPVNTDIHKHWCRLDLLMDYTDLLPTTTATPKISQEDRKQYFFETFPLKWRHEFISTKNRLLCNNGSRYQTIHDYEKEEGRGRKEESTRL